MNMLLNFLPFQSSLDMAASHAFRLSEVIFIPVHHFHMQTRVQQNPIQYQ